METKRNDFESNIFVCIFHAQQQHIQSSSIYDAMEKKTRILLASGILTCREIMVSIILCMKLQIFDSKKSFLLLVEFILLFI